MILILSKSKTRKDIIIPFSWYNKDTGGVIPHGKKRLHYFKSLGPRLPFLDSRLERSIIGTVVEILPQYIRSAMGGLGGMLGPT